MQRLDKEIQEQRRKGKCVPLEDAIPVLVEFGFRRRIVWTAEVLKRVQRSRPRVQVIRHLPEMPQHPRHGQDQNVRMQPPSFAICHSALTLFW